MSLANRYGLHGLARQHVTIAVRTGVNPGLKMPCPLAGMIADADSIDGMDLLRQVQRTSCPQGSGRRIRDLHVEVRVAHAPAVGAGTAGRHTQLVGEFLLEDREVGPPEFPVDSVIACTAGHEGIYYRLAGYARRRTEARYLHAS